MNPARSLAPAVVAGRLEHLWVYLTAPVVGALAGVLVCGVIHGPGCCCRPERERGRSDRSGTLTPPTPHGRFGRTDVTFILGTTMNLDAFLAVLSENPAAAVHLMLPDGDFVPAHFHVTEVGRVHKDFIDCGGTVRSATTCVLQVWVADDTDHRLDTTKLADDRPARGPAAEDHRPAGRGRVRGRAGVAVPGVRRRGHAVRRPPPPGHQAHGLPGTRTGAASMRRAPSCCATPGCC